jgi:hypothetical protein
MAMRWMAALSCRLPPRHSRWRSVRPELAGIGGTPACMAKQASERPPARRRGPQRGLDSIQASRQQALGRSRGGLTTKLHTICDGRGRNLATRLTPAQDADTTQLVGLVDQVRVAGPAVVGGRARDRIT